MFTVKQGLGLSSSSSSSSSEIEEKVEQQQQRPWWKQQQQRSVIGFASVGAAAGGGGHSASAPAFSFAPPLPRGKKESRTGTDFPSELCHVQKKACPVLTGVG